MTAVGAGLLDSGVEVGGPEFEHEEGEEAVGVVASPPKVFGEESFDGGAVEVGGGEGVLGEEEVVEGVAEGGAEPSADGDGEAFFATGEDGGGEVGGEGLAEEGFGGAVRQELIIGEAVGELDEMVVEEGGADFEGVGHGSGIDFAEEVAGEVGELVGEEGGAEG